MFQRVRKAKIHIARALIMNPEIMVMQRPCSHFDEVADARNMMHHIKDHALSRGLQLPKDRAHKRRQSGL